jgi:hypothetical protein
MQIISKTATLGNYYGIYKDNQLVAVTGERMQERFYRSQCGNYIRIPWKRICKTVGSAYRKYNFNQNKPLSCMYMKKLWSYQAIRKMGFETRRENKFWNITKKE